MYFFFLLQLRPLLIHSFGQESLSINILIIAQQNNTHSGIVNFRQDVYESGDQC